MQRICWLNLIYVHMYVSMEYKVKACVHSVLAHEKLALVGLLWMADPDA